MAVDHSRADKRRGPRGTQFVASVLVACIAWIAGIACLAMPCRLSFASSQATLGHEAFRVVNDWCLDLINAPNDLAPGPHPVRIAILDSGIWTDNPFFAGRIGGGYNYALGNTDTNDLIGHGSHTVGIILGGRCGDRELVGLGSQAAIVPLVWITKYPSKVVASGGVPALCSAIRDAVDVYGCRIINISSGITADEPEMREAVSHAEEKGAIVISAVGNTNATKPDEIYYPAAYKTVIGVGAVGESSLVSEFSQRNESVTVTAPGEKLYSISQDADEDFEEVSGTSYAAAYVSGFAALLLSRHPDMTPAAFRKLLADSTQDLGQPGYDTAYGWGLLDVSRGLTLAAETAAVTKDKPIFCDVSGWYEEYVCYLAERGIVTGKGDGLFAPEDDITRAEFVAMLARMSGEVPPVDASGLAGVGIADSPGSFVDVVATDWFFPLVSWAASEGVARGHEGRFFPDQDLSRQDMAVMLVRFAERGGKTPLPEAAPSFVDANRISAYAVAAVGKLQKAGVLCGGPSGVFDPRGAAKRCDAAKVCAELLKMEAAVSQN